jgi:hypothetical protein
MKKLIAMMFAATGLAFAGNASSYYWGITSDAGNNGFAGDTVYVILASAWSDTIDLNGVKSAANTLTGSDAGNSYVKKLNKTGIATTSFDYGSTDVSGDTLNVIFVQVNADGDYFKWSDTLTSTASTSSEKTVETFSAATMATYASGGYTSFAPEPTSGLLLLLGAAGLALKRKRA